MAKQDQVQDQVYKTTYRCWLADNDHPRQAAKQQAAVCNDRNRERGLKKMKKENSIILFNQQKVRRHWDDNKEQWYFSIVDVVAALTDSSNPRRYWSDLKTKLKQEGSEVYEKIVQLKMTAPDGKQRQTDCSWVKRRLIF